MKGTEFDLFDLVSLITLWNDSVKVRKPNQKKVEKSKLQKKRMQSKAKTFFNESAS